MNSANEAINHSFPLPFGSNDLAEMMASATGSPKHTNTTQNIKTTAPHSDARATDAASTASSITEVVFTRHNSGDNLLLLPMVAYLSQIADRWVTWFTSELPQASLLQHYGVDVGKIRVIHNRGCADQREMVGEALGNGTSHTVIASFDTLSRNDANRLEFSAARGHSKALIVRYR